LFIIVDFTNFHRFEEKNPRIIIITLSIYKNSNFIAFAIKIETIFILYTYKHTSTIILLTMSLFTFMYMLWIKYWALIYRPLIYRPWIFPATSFWIKVGGLALYYGFNVAFPTETVYGLGASIWSLTAILGIFRKKRRPITNPFIVHIPSYSDVFKHDLTCMSPNEEVVFELLADKFWPGPLTFVVPANTAKVDPIIRNNTPFVGLRVPADPTALALLQAAGVPIAAPSANRYQMVSPGSADDVYDDYTGLGIFMPILKGEKNRKRVGVESSIVMIHEVNGIVHLIILRAGAITAKNLVDTLVGMCDIPYVVVEKCNDVNGSTSVAPGQALLHYSPENATTYIGTTNTSYIGHIDSIDHAKSVLIATEKVVRVYGGKYQTCFTLPSTSKECASELYSVMRKANAFCKVSGSVNIVICIEGISGEEGCGLLEAVEDKIRRASAGKAPIGV
jgi:L-threonylcarbamoyladenylate synthase